MHGTGRPARRAGRDSMYYDRGFVTPADRAETLAWLQTIHPIWEERYSKNNPPPAGQSQRGLLRPVYWLGNWQFACLDYYHPPKGVENRCVAAEPFPAVLQRMVARIEAITRRMFRGPDLPARWRLNTCLVNFYGARLEGGRKVDVARVGEHKDFEPGPVASVSLGARALFQFVESRRVGTREGVALQQWLDDGSLQIFGGERLKKRLFHRVQRVDRKGAPFRLNVESFETRRVNFTFRYVPDEHIVRYAALPRGAAEDIRPYVELLARHSEFFAAELRSRS